MAQRRMTGLGLFCVLLFLLLEFNLWRVQIVDAEYYAEKALGNVMKPAATSTIRGPIVDRNGVVLAKSVSDMALVLDWTELQSGPGAGVWQETVRVLAEYIKPYWPYPQQSPELIAEDICVMIRNQQWTTYNPVVVLEDVPESLRALIAEHSDELPGVCVKPLAKRFYPQGTLMGQVLGYVREISREELDEREEIDERGECDEQEESDVWEDLYRQGDMIGKMGVEKSFDVWLRGHEGLDKVEVDQQGRPVSRTVVQEPQVGYTVYLALDAGLQRDVERSLDEVITRVTATYPKAGVGAAVVMEVKTGKILAMVSKPYMDPNELIGVVSDETAARYFTGAEAATKNRAIMDTYPPGSVYKMLVASSALELGVITPEDKVYDALSSLGPGGVQAQAVAEWGGNNFGWVNLYRGLAKSCNIYFQSLGRKVFEQDPEYMKKIGNEFGFGALSGIDLPGEVAGIAPSPAWKNSFFGPGYETEYQAALAAVESQLEEVLSRTVIAEERDLLLSETQNEMRRLEAEYEINKGFHVEWRLSDSFNNSIGQGYNANTLLQLANYVAVIANGGTLYKPQIVDRIVDTRTGETIKEFEPEVINQVSVSSENLAAVKEAMSLVTKGEGTAAFVFADMPGFSGGGKTGTAQVGNKTGVSYYNGMFVAFAPYDDPEIAVSVLVEYGGAGGDTAGRVAKAAFRSYFGW
ncbi:MAG: penicillin-binding protein 2 [Peptococcaceae bacterium]|nr:penicillin-binding protein 2 [Peptococcaceae bacterium]